MKLSNTLYQVMLSANLLRCVNGELVRGVRGVRSWPKLGEFCIVIDSWHIKWLHWI
jgi:hypothetical protein